MNAHIQIVGWNHRAQLAACVRSCLQQTVRVPVLYIDNASEDHSARFVREEFPDVRVLALKENRGYSGGHNAGLSEISNTDVVVVLNPDVVLQPDFIEKGLPCFTSERVGAVAPLLLRPDGDTIDAFGDVLRKSLRAVNQYSGQSLSKLKTQNSKLESPWGFSGAAAFLRREALEDIAIDGEIFDEDLFAYREDVDLSWRLHHRGWEIIGASAARAKHVRAVRAGEEKLPEVARLSWRNYFLVLVKDVSFSLLFLHLPWVLAETILRKIQWLFRPTLWPAATDFLRLFPSMLRKRRHAL